MSALRLVLALLLELFVQAVQAVQKHSIYMKREEPGVVVPNEERVLSYDG